MAFFDGITGYGEIEIEGLNGERVLSVLARENRNVWSVRRRNGKITLRSSLSDVKKVLEISENLGVPAVNTRTAGVLPWLWDHRMRSGFAVGFLLLFTVLFIMFSFIWSIDITGLYAIPEAEFREALKGCDLYIGALTSGHDLDNIRLELMRQFDEIAFVTLNMNGSRLEIDVTEGILPPEIVNLSSPCNIIASADGVLAECETYQGVKKVKPGDAVRKGDLLASGVYKSKVIGYRLVRADAKMMAYTRRDYSVFVPYQYEHFAETGNKSQKYRLKIFNISIDVPFTGTESYQFYDINTEEIRMTVFNTEIPVSLFREERTELCRTVETLSEEEAEKIALDELEEKMRLDLFGIEVVSETVKCTHTESGVACAAICTVIEDIAQPSPILREIIDKKR